MAAPHASRPAAAARACALAALLSALAVFTAMAIVWRDTGRFSTFLDCGGPLLRDFAGHFLPMGRAILHSPHPVHGFFYPAFAALALAWAAPLSDGAATSVWGALQLLALAALVAAALREGRVRTPLACALATVLVLTSTPVLHNLKWGQVSVFVTLLGLGALDQSRRGRPYVAGVLLALATALKLYPAVLVVDLVARGDRRAVVTWALMSAVLLVALPALVLGPAAAVAFHTEIAAAITAAGRWIVRDDNSQELVNVTRRWLLVPEGGAWETPLRVAGWLLALALWARAAQLARRGAGLATSAVLLLGTLPLLLTTSWPHYFVFLPFAQVVFAGRLAARERWRGERWRLAALGASILLTSLLLPAAIDNWGYYARRGGPVFSTLFLVLLAALPPRGAGPGAACRKSVILSL